MVVSGVRSSWETLETKSSLAVSRARSSSWIRDSTARPVLPGRELVQCSRDGQHLLRTGQLGPREGVVLGHLLCDGLEVAQRHAELAKEVAASHPDQQPGQRSEREDSEDRGLGAERCVRARLPRATIEAFLRILMRLAEGCEALLSDLEQLRVEGPGTAVRGDSGLGVLVEPGLCSIRLAGDQPVELGVVAGKLARLVLVAGEPRKGLTVVVERRVLAAALPRTDRCLHVGEVLEDVLVGRSGRLEILGEVAVRAGGQHDPPIATSAITPNRIPRRNTVGTTSRATGRPEDALSRTA